MSTGILKGVLNGHKTDMGRPRDPGIKIAPTD